MNMKNQNKILYGGDYNPEQWPETIWEEDMRLFKLAHIDVLTINVFNWAGIQKDETTYDFSKLDKVMTILKENHRKVCLATSTGAFPAWMARKYPDTLRVTPEGSKRNFGGRHNFCPNSKTYRKYAAELVEKTAERYCGMDNLIAWHISNEYGGECYCEHCEQKFRSWLKEKYGTIEEVNRVWNMTFWGHTLYDWDDIVLPDFRTEEFMWEGLQKSCFQGISLDYKRFNSDSLLACFRMEYEIVKKYTPDVPVTTNLMGTYKNLDYQKWAKYMDFISWDNYPDYKASSAEIAFRHDVMRGLKNGMPFALMEQTPSVSNWQPYCSLKRPGVMRLWSYQAVAHGADSIMFFQMRRSAGACEKYHGAVIDHCGHENTRVFREIAQLGNELDAMGNQTLGGRTPAEVAILFDWDNWWAVELSAGPSKDINYIEEVLAYYTCFYNNHIAVDIVSVDADISKYKILIAPLLYMCKDGADQKIKEFVSKGGCFLSTYFSGYVDQNDLVILGGYPGKWKELLGIWVEESDALPEGSSNEFYYRGKKHPAKIVCDLLHLQGAVSLGDYEQDFYRGMPAITRNKYGEGEAYYIGTRSEKEFYELLWKDICAQYDVKPLLNAPVQIEATLRKNQNGSYLFLLNHSNESLKCILPCEGTDIIHQTEYFRNAEISIEARDVMIIRIPD